MTRPLLVFGLECDDPGLEPDIEELATWFTTERLKVAWDLAKKRMRTKEYNQSPAASLILQIGVSSKTFYKWLDGHSKPHVNHLRRLTYVLRHVIGEDWQAVVDLLLNPKGQS